MKSRRIASTRTDHFCNFDGIAKTLFCCHRKDHPKHGKSLSAVSGRKRYNTLDFAGQNRVPKADLPALLWNPPRYRQHHFRVSERNAFCRYSFSPRAAKTKKCYLQQRGENERTCSVEFKRILVCALCYIEKTTVNGKITYLQIYDVMFLGTDETLLQHNFF